MSGCKPMALSDRFWPKVQKSDHCWEWTGYRMPNGYGQILGMHRKRIPAHRAAWIVTHGVEPPRNIDVCHSCDNRSCVRPDHLFLGSRLDNVRDAMRKGRHAKGERSGPAKLTAGAVLEIRAAAGHHFAIGSQYNVSEATVRDIKSRRTWRHVE